MTDSTSTFCYVRPGENKQGHCLADHPVEAGINWFHEYTDNSWSFTESLDWCIRFKCWTLNLRQVTEWAARLLFLTQQVEKRETGIDSSTLAKLLMEEGLVPKFWNTHKKQKVPNILGDLEYLLLTMNRLFPDKYKDLILNDLYKISGKTWSLREIAKQFLWQEYGESYKAEIRKLKKLVNLDQNNKKKEDTDIAKPKNIFNSKYMVQLLIYSSTSDQIYLMFQIKRLTHNKYHCEVLNEAHYPADRGDGTKWKFYKDNKQIRWCRWNVVKTKDDLPHCL